MPVCIFFSMAAKFPAAWYPDPSKDKQMRYWDGQAWTRQVYRISSDVVLATYKTGPQPPAEQITQDLASQETIIAETSQGVEGDESIEEVISQAEDLVPAVRHYVHQDWNQTIAGTSTWALAQKNKAAAIAAEQLNNFSVLDNGYEPSTIFEEGSGQQLWGESDKPNQIKKAWHKVPRTWRKPVLAVTALALLFWIGPTLLNFAVTAVSNKAKIEGGQRVIETIDAKRKQSSYEEGFNQIWEQAQKRRIANHSLYASPINNLLYQCPRGVTYFSDTQCKEVKTNMSILTDQGRRPVTYTEKVPAEFQVPAGMKTTAVLVSGDCFSALDQDATGKVTGKETICR